ISLPFHMTTVPLTASALYLLFLFNHPAPPEIYTLSLHDALPISDSDDRRRSTNRITAAGKALLNRLDRDVADAAKQTLGHLGRRSEEHTSELQSRSDLVCRLLLEKKKKRKNKHNT